MADRSYVRTYPHDSLRHFDKLLREVGAIFNQTRLQNLRSVDYYEAYKQAVTWKS
jgi:hypothetical protein